MEQVLSLVLEYAFNVLLKSKQKSLFAKGSF